MTNNTYPSINQESNKIKRNSEFLTKEVTESNKESKDNKEPSLNQNKLQNYDESLSNACQSFPQTYNIESRKMNMNFLGINSVLPTFSNFQDQQELIKFLVTNGSLQNLYIKNPETAYIPHPLHTNQTPQTQCNKENVFEKSQGNILGKNELFSNTFEPFKSFKNYRDKNKDKKKYSKFPPSQSKTNDSPQKWNNFNNKENDVKVIINESNLDSGSLQQVENKIVFKESTNDINGTKEGVINEISEEYKKSINNLLNNIIKLGDSMSKLPNNNNNNTDNSKYNNEYKDNENNKNYNDYLQQKRLLEPKKISNHEANKFSIPSSSLVSPEDLGNLNLMPSTANLETPVLNALNTLNSLNTLNTLNTGLILNDCNKMEKHKVKKEEEQIGNQSQEKISQLQDSITSESKNINNSIQNKLFRVEYDNLTKYPHNSQDSKILSISKNNEEHKDSFPYDNSANIYYPEDQKANYKSQTLVVKTNFNTLMKNGLKKTERKNMCNNSENDENNINHKCDPKLIFKPFLVQKPFLTEIVSTNNNTSTNKSNNFSNTKNSNNITNDEEKRSYRKLLNRNAAKKCRQKKKYFVEALIDENLQLKKKIKELEKRLNQTQQLTDSTTINQYLQLNKLINTTTVESSVSTKSRSNEDSIQIIPQIHKTSQNCINNSTNNESLSH